MNMWTRVYVASKCREPIIRVLQAKVPIATWAKDMPNYDEEWPISTLTDIDEYNGKPLYYMYAHHYDNDKLTIETDTGLNNDEVVIYYKKLHEEFVNRFSGPRQLMDYLVRIIGNKGSVVIYDVNNKILSYYDGKKIFARNPANDHYKSFTMENQLYADSFKIDIWFELVREEQKSIRDDSLDEHITQLYEEIMEDYISIYERKVKKDVIQRLAELEAYPDSIEIAGKTFGILDRNINTRLLECFKRRIEERGGFVIWYDYQNDPRLLVEKRFVFDGKEDFFILIYSKEDDLISISKTKIVSELEIWATLLNTNKLAREDAEAYRKRAKARYEATEDFSNIKEYIHRNDKNYLEKVESWKKGDYDIKKILERAGLSETEIQKIDLNANIIFKDRYFVLCSQYDWLDESATAHRAIVKAIIKRGGYCNTFGRKETPDYIILTEPYDKNVVQRLLSISQNSNIITDIQFWKAAYQEYNKEYLPNEISRMTKERYQRAKEEKEAEKIRYEEYLAQKKEERRKAIEDLKKEYAEKPIKPITLAALKREHPEINWSGVAKYIEKNYHKKPAAWFKAEGIIGTGKEVRANNSVKNDTNIVNQQEKQLKTKECDESEKNVYWDSVEIRIKAVKLNAIKKIEKIDFSKVGLNTTLKQVYNTSVSTNDRSRSYTLLETDVDGFIDDVEDETVGPYATMRLIHEAFGKDGKAVIICKSVKNSNELHECLVYYYYGEEIRTRDFLDLDTLYYYFNDFLEILLDLTDEKIVMIHEEMFEKAEEDDRNSVEKKEIEGLKCYDRNHLAYEIAAALAAPDLENEKGKIVDLYDSAEVAALFDAIDEKRKSCVVEYDELNNNDFTPTFEWEEKGIATFSKHEKEVMNDKYRKKTTKTVEKSRKLMKTATEPAIEEKGLGISAHVIEKPLKNELVNETNKEQPGDDSSSAFLEIDEDKAKISDREYAGLDYTYVIFPKSVQFVGKGAFEDCLKLEEIEINEGLTSIDAYAFSNCPKLQSVHLPDTIKFVDENAFADNKSGNNESHIIVQLSGDTAYRLETTRKFYSRNAFTAKRFEIDGKQYQDLASYVKEKDEGQKQKEKIASTSEITLQEIAKKTFDEAVLKETRNTSQKLVIPEGKTSISNREFADSEYDSVVLPMSLRGIGSYAFESCMELRTVEINEGLKVIGFYAFSNCPKLKIISLPESIETVDRTAFVDEGTNLEDTHITVYMSGKTARRLERTKKYSSEEAVIAHGFVIDGKCYNVLSDYVSTEMNKKTYLSDSDEEFYVPNLQKPSIVQSNELICLRHQKVVIPEGVKFVCSDAMKFSLTQVLKLPHSLRTIDKYAFAHNEYINKVIFQEGLSSILDGAFLDSPALKEVTLPKSLISIKPNAFAKDMNSHESNVIVQLSGKTAETLYSNKTIEDEYTLDAGGFIIDGRSYRSIEEYIDEIKRFDRTKRGIIPITPSDQVIREIQEHAQIQSASGLKIIRIPYSERIDYSNAEQFEEALNHGENTESQIVRFKVLKVVSDYMGGFNLWAGEHLNFLSRDSFNVEIGDTVLAKVHRAHKGSKVSWLIIYDRVEYEPNISTKETTDKRREEEKRKERERRADEQHKERQRNDIKEMIRQAEQERDSLKGVFAVLKRKKLQKEIDELKDQLRKI